VHRIELGPSPRRQGAFSVTDAVFAIPGDINLPTGGYAYDRRVLTLLPDMGIAARHLVLPGSFPDPAAADLATAEALLAGVDVRTPVMIDGLAYGAMPETLIARIRAPVVALVHHPLCLEAGLAEARQRQLHALETAALALARRIVVTSRITARTLVADFAVPAGRITVAEPGTDPAPRAQGAGASMRFLAVGAVVPRKAYHVLARALAPLRDRDWHLTIAGPTDRSAEALALLDDAIRDASLQDRITVAGPVAANRLADLYAAADALLMPSLYEGYGMVLAEAMARGLPIVCTTGGAAAETVPDGAAIKVQPGDAGALTVAIGRLLDDPGLRRRLADASWAAGQALPRWEDAARSIADVIKSLASAEHQA
jgi:glycosyltransferase involved in cell wall biosynthesis